MSSRLVINTLRLSLGITAPLLVDLAYHECYLIPSNVPNLYANSRPEELLKPTGVPFGIPPTLTFTRYRTENPWHAQYIYAKKSFWRYNTLWPFTGVVSAALQLIHIIQSVRLGSVLGVVGAAGAMALTWTGIFVEGKSRRMYLDAMHDKVMKEEEAFSK